MSGINNQNTSVLSSSTYNRVLLNNFLNDRSSHSNNNNNNNINNNNNNNNNNNINNNNNNNNNNNINNNNIVNNNNNILEPIVINVNNNNNINNNIPNNIYGYEEIKQAYEDGELAIDDPPEKHKIVIKSEADVIARKAREKDEIDIKARKKGFKIVIEGVDERETILINYVSTIKFENVYGAILEGGKRGIEKSFKQRKSSSSFTFVIPITNTWFELKDWINDKSNYKRRCLYYTIYDPYFFDVTFTFYGVSVKRVDYEFKDGVFCNSVTVQAQLTDWCYGEKKIPDAVYFYNRKLKAKMQDNGEHDEELAYMAKTSYPDNVNEEEDIDYLNPSLDPDPDYETSGEISSTGEKIKWFFTKALEKLSLAGKLVNSVIWDYAEWAFEKFYIDKPYDDRIEELDEIKKNAEEMELERHKNAEKRIKEDTTLTDEQRLAQLADEEVKHDENNNAIEKEYDDEKKIADEKKEKKKKVYDHVSMTCLNMAKNGTFSFFSWTQDKAVDAANSKSNKDKKGKNNK